MCYSPVQQTTASHCNHRFQQPSNIYGVQNYSYQTSSSSSFYQATQQQISTSSHPIASYSSSNGLPSTATALLPGSMYAHEDKFPILDL